MSTTVWTDVLDRLEADVERYEALADGDADATVPPTFEPPAGLGALPASLQDRAVEVLRRLAEAETLLVDRRDGLARELSAARKVTDTHPDKAPRFVDRSA